MYRFLAIRAVAAAALICTGCAAFAQTADSVLSGPSAVVVTDATLRPVDGMAVVSSAAQADPLVYGANSVPGTAATPTLAQQGTAFTFAGSGPQQRITGLRVYVNAEIAAVYQRIRAKVKFWDVYQLGAPDQPVFSSAPAMSEVVIDLTGPFNLPGGTRHMIEANLPKPLLFNGYQSRGVAVQVLASTGFQEPEQKDGLLPSFYYNSVPMAGSIVASFGNDGSQLYNFRGDQTITGKTLAIQLYGAAQKTVQCGTWTSHGDQFIEEFDSFVAPRWALDLNGGTTPQNGGITLSGGNSGFPYLRVPNLDSPSVPIPPAGEFSVRWLAKYLRVGGSGDGLVVSRGQPTNANNGSDTPRVVTLWQDNGGLRASVVTDANQPNPMPVFPEAAGANTVTHDFEYCWLANSVQLWVDGTKVADAPRNANVQRPDSVWIGNFGTGFSNWNDMQVFRVHVRTPHPSDTLFYDTFE